MLIELSKNPEIGNELTPLDGAVEATNALLEEGKNDDANILLLLAGGSSLKILPGINIDLISSKTTISSLDERYSLNPSENNMEQIMQTEFFSKARENGANLIDTRVLEGESQEALAERFNKALNDWIIENPKGKIIATVGIGPDGHFAGIMPHPEDPGKFHDLFDKDPSQLAVGYDATGKNEFPQRVTTTLSLIRRIGAAVCYVVGENKRDALEKLSSEEGSIESTPARILREIPGKVFLFTDQT